MLNVLRRMLPQATRIRIKKALGRPATQLNPDWEVLRSIGPVERPHVVIDAGAHHGWFFHCWLDWCPQAHVHAFEPTEESFQAATSNYGADPRVTLVKAGLGSQVGELTLNILEDSKVSNSFLAPSPDVWKSIAYGTGEISTRKVPVTTLDVYCAEKKIDNVYLLKIDVQGFEMELLKGTVGTLPRIDHVLVEAGIQRLYEGAPAFNEVCAFFEANGFHLMHMRAWHRGNQVLVETDMLFRRNDLAPPIDLTRERYYVSLKE